MQKRVRPWLIVVAIGVVAVAVIVSRLNRIITVSEVLVTRNYTIEETPYKDSIVCTEDGTLLGSVQNSYTEENYIFISDANVEKALSSQVQAYIPTGTLFLNNTNYAQRENVYYLLLKDIQASNKNDKIYTFIKFDTQTADIEKIYNLRAVGVPQIIDTGTDTLLLSYWVQEGACIEKYSIKNNKMTDKPISIESCYEEAVPLNEQQFVCGYNRLTGPKGTDEKYKSYLGWVDIDGNVLTSYNLGKYFVEKVIIDKSKIYVLLTHRNTTKNKLLTADLDFENKKFKNIQIYRLLPILDSKFTMYREMTYDAEKQRLNFMVRGPFAWDWSSSFLGAAYIDLKDGKIVPEVKAEIITNLNRSFYPECTYIGDDTTFYFSNLKGELLYMKASN